MQASNTSESTAIDSTPPQGWQLALSRFFFAFFRGLLTHSQGGADQGAPQNDDSDDFLSFRPNYSKKKGSGLCAPVLPGKLPSGLRRLVYDRDLVMSLRVLCTVPPPDFLVELSPEEQQLVLMGEDAPLGGGDMSDNPPSPGMSPSGASDKQHQPQQPQPNASPNSWRGGGSPSTLPQRSSGGTTYGARRSGGGGSGVMGTGSNQTGALYSEEGGAEQSPREPITSPVVPVAPLKPGKGAWVAPSAIGNLGMSSESKIVGNAKGILNKLTKLTFDKLSDELLALLNKHPEQLGEFVSIIFEKVCLEPTFCAMYARLCVKLADVYRDPASKDAAETRRAVLKVLLEKCQAEFESNEKADKEREALRAQKAAREREKNLAVIEGDLSSDRPVTVVAMGSDPERELELEQRHRYKKLGNVTFLGELFRLRMVPEKTIHGCIIYLLRNITNPLEEDVEHLCKLLTIAGKEVDTPRAKAYMDQYFDRITKLSKRKNVASRLRFMLQDVVALRSNAWSSVRKEVADGDEEQTAVQQPLATETRLSSPLAAMRAPKGAAMADAQPEAVLLSAAEVARIKQEMRFIVEEFVVSEDVEEVVLSIQELKFLSVEFRAIFVYMSMIFAMERGAREHRLMCRAFARLREANLLSASDFIKSWSKVIEELDEIVKDIVFVKQLLADFVVAAISSACVSRAQFGLLLERHRGNAHCEEVTRLVEAQLSSAGPKQ